MRQDAYDKTAALEGVSATVLSCIGRNAVSSRPALAPDGQASADRYAPSRFSYIRPLLSSGVRRPVSVDSRTIIGHSTLNTP